MPPSCGKRDESSVTTSPCGTKKSNPASTQSASALGPAFAAVASHRRPTTATRLKSTRSRSPRLRARSGRSSDMKESVERDCRATGSMDPSGSYAIPRTSVPGTRYALQSLNKYDPLRNSASSVLLNPLNPSDDGNSNGCDDVRVSAYPLPYPRKNTVPGFGWYEKRKS